MHIYTTLKFHLTCARMAKINKQMTAHAGDNVRKITQAGGSAATAEDPNVIAWELSPGLSLGAQEHFIVQQIIHS